MPEPVPIPIPIPIPTTTPAPIPTPTATATGADDTIPDLDSFPPTGTPKHDKLSSWDFYRSMGSPKRVVAPMVDQSELPWRVLSRRYGSDLVYTPMINAKLFVDVNCKRNKTRYQEINFNKTLAEEGAHTLSLPPTSDDTDRPLLVQFCANDPDILLKAAEVVQDRCDGVDLNLGCPQHIAKRGHYGSFLMEDWPLIFSLINILHINLKVPVTAKMRVYDSLEKTIAYARMLERAGAQIITVHGRTREMKGHKTGLADWAKIRAVKNAVNVPVFANGNVLYPQDWRDSLAQTTADGVMSAEGNLYNPAIFADPLPSQPSHMWPHAPQLPFPSITAIGNEYLDIVADLKTPTQASAIKAHLFRLCRPALEVHRDLREVLGKSHLDPKLRGHEAVKPYRDFLSLLDERLAHDRTLEKYQHPPDVALPGSIPLLPRDKDQEDKHRPAYIPHWLAQPYFRPPLPPRVEEDPEAKSERKKARAERLAETKAKVHAITADTSRPRSASPERTDVPPEKKTRTE